MFAHKLQSYSFLSFHWFVPGPKDVLSNCTVEADLEEDYRARMGFVVKTCPFANSSFTLRNYEFIGYMLMLRRSLDNYGSATLVQLLKKKNLLVHVIHYGIHPRYLTNCAGVWLRTWCFDWFQLDSMWPQSDWDLT
jgi:hypothetical protein